MKLNNVYHCLETLTNLISQYCSVVNNEFIMINYH